MEAKSIFKVKTWLWGEQAIGLAAVLQWLPQENIEALCLTKNKYTNALTKPKKYVHRKCLENKMGYKKDINESYKREC